MHVKLKSADKIVTVDKFATIDRIAIIGSSGAGKTTLADMLGSRLGLKVYHLDRLFWQYGWKRKDRETRIDILQDLVREKQWIIEGTYLNSSDLHLDEADAIILLDISSFKCCYRIIKRHFKSKALPRHDIPLGSTNRLTFPGLLKVLFFPLGTKRKLEDKLSKCPPEKVVIRFRSRKEVERFLAQPETYIDEMESSSSSVATVPILAFVIIATSLSAIWYLSSP